jgi:cyclase
MELVLPMSALVWLVKFSVMVRLNLMDLKHHAMKKHMFCGAGPLIFARARELRMFSTEAERRLWGYLRTKPLRVKFRRQHPCGKYVVDFYAHKIKLVVEADGDIHADPEQAEKDRIRQSEIESDGITVIRFTNDQIMHDLDNVKAIIENDIKQLLTSHI